MEKLKEVQIIRDENEIDFKRARDSHLRKSISSGIREVQRSLPVKTRLLESEIAEIERDQAKMFEMEDQQLTSEYFESNEQLK